MYDKFPLGFWNYARPSEYGVETVKDWADCGMTLTMTPSFYENDSKEDMLAIMDEAHKRGIKLIVRDNRVSVQGLDEIPQDYKERFIQSYTDFGTHPATVGFHIGDEPRGKQFFPYIDAYKIQKEVAPELSPFINFLPFFESMGKDIWYKDSFSEWAEWFIKETNLEYLCYDCYTQMNPGEDGINTYYMDLRLYNDAAKKAGIPFWTTLLSVGHFVYRVPTEDDFRWQVYSSVVSGCKGLLFFYFYMRGISKNYRLAPIDEHNERTETYRALSRTLKTFEMCYGDIMLRLQHDNTYHFLKAYGGYELFEEKERPYIKNIKSEHNLPAVISYFTDTNGDKYIALLNNSQREPGLFTLKFDNSVKEVWKTGWMGKQFNLAKNHHDIPFSDDGGLFVGAWLAPGQMELLRLVFDK